MGCTFSDLAAKFAFFPPTPATYAVKKWDGEGGGGGDGKLTAVTVSSSSSKMTASSSSVPLADDNALDVLMIETKHGNKIVAFYLKNPYARLTLLYSHGNAADLGQLYDLFLQLKVNLRVNLMGYDYSGYGASTGKPSESNTYADIEAVYECLQTQYGVSQEDLILYGQSVGSGPTLHLAAKLPRLRGVVLHSAILSGLRVLCHVKFTFCFDIYKGTEDDVVNWLHGDGLWKMAKDPYEPLWIKGGGHCNLELYPDYIRHLCRFIHEMENITTEVRLKKIRQNLCLQKRSNSSSAATTSRCCKIKCWRPKRPECSRPRCVSCSWRPKCPECLRPSFGKCCWRPKCPTCSCPKCSWPKCSCLKCSCLKCLCPKCSCPKCSCSCPKCLCPKCSCLKCSRPCCCIPCFRWRCCGPKCSCLKCSRPCCCIPCFRWRCCGGEHCGGTSEKQAG
ncbi:protein ABHD17B isoform X2 [Morus notabilis]|uniref:protein ABHD17B isoform X2 n=1 Tax=Morus notabilis TaxID=981085 RepID=UPI000CED3A7C|nr:protein ABHD17B isoform X2 [Morus notabilis]